LARIALLKASWQTPQVWKEAASFLQSGIANLTDEAQRRQLRQELASLYADAGRALNLSKKYPEALEFLNKSIEVMPSVRGHFYRATTYLNTPGQSQRVRDDYRAVIALTEAADPPTYTPEYIGSKLDLLESLIIDGKYNEAISGAEETLKRFRSSKDSAALEPVVRLLMLSAKIAGGEPSYRVDVDELRVVADNSPRRYTYGSFEWQFGAIDKFIDNKPDIPNELRCLFREISQTVQRGKGLRMTYNEGCA
jgi:tetratricopeptide (TPR) repeat protein